MRPEKKRFNPLGCDDDWSTSQASTHAQARSNEAAWDALLVLKDGQMGDFFFSIFHKRDTRAYFIPHHWTLLLFWRQAETTTTWPHDNASRITTQHQTYPEQMIRAPGSSLSIIQTSVTIPSRLYWLHRTSHWAMMNRAVNSLLKNRVIHLVPPKVYLPVRWWHKAWRHTRDPYTHLVRPWIL